MSTKKFKITQISDRTQNGNIILKFQRSATAELGFGAKNKKETYYMAVIADNFKGSKGDEVELNFDKLTIVERPFYNEEAQQTIMLKWLHIKEGSQGKNDVTMVDRDILVVDIETTGFLEQGGKIVEIGIVRLDLNTGKIAPVFNSVVKEDGFDVSQTKEPLGWIFRNSDLTFQDVKNAPTLESKRDEIQNLFNQYHATAYNKDFDFNFLKSRGFGIKELPCPMLSATPILNLPSKNNFKSPKWPTVEEAFEFFFPHDDYREAHRGLDDALHEAMIVQKLYEIGKFKITKISKNIHGHYGPVKVCKKTAKTYKYSRGFKEVESDQETIETYNEEGLLIEWQRPHCREEHNFKETYLYDEEGKRTELNKYNYGGNVHLKKETYLYGDNGKRTELNRIIYSEDEHLRIDYDKYGNRILEVYNYLSGDLKGKSFKKEYYYEYDAQGKILCYSQPGFQGGVVSTQYYYDEKGRLIKEENNHNSYCFDDVTIYSYDNRDNIIEKSHYRLDDFMEIKDSCLEYRVQSKYDASNRIIEKVELKKTADGFQYSSNQYKYDSLNRLIELVELGKESSPEYRSIFEYNSFGFLLRRSYNYTDDRLTTTQTELSNFDKYNNWQKKITKDNGAEESLTIREFKYFE